MPRLAWYSVAVALLLLPAAFLYGCGDDPVSPVAPSIESAEVAVNPMNNLSTLVSFTTQGVEEARVIYWTGTGAPLATPYYPVHDGAGEVAVLGLDPLTTYNHIVEGRGPGGDASSATLSADSGDLPAFLKTLNLNGSGTPSGGYTFMTIPSGGYVVAYNQAGEICWYRAVEGYLGRDAGQQPNNNFVAFVGSTIGFQTNDVGYYVEFEPGGKEVARHLAIAPYFTDNHELILETDPSGSVRSSFFSYDLRTIDLSQYGGPENARIAGHQIMRLRDGVLEYMFDAWDHFSIEDAIDEPGLLTGCTLCDFDHPNALALDNDGHYLASWADLGEITKVDYNTGEIIWRFGGNHNQFTILNDPMGGFSKQHFVRALDNGNLLFYDNGARHNPPQSRAVEYQLDTVNMTATLVWEYRHDPPIFTPVVGSAQRLSNGNTFVGFTNKATMVEVDPAGNVVWEGLMEANEFNSFYRAFRIGSLYEFQAP